MAGSDFRRRARGFAVPVVVMSIIVGALALPALGAGTESAAAPAAQPSGSEEASSAETSVKVVKAETFPAPPAPSANELNLAQEALAQSPRPGPEGDVFEGPEEMPLGPATDASKAPQATTDLTIFRNTALPAGGLRSPVNEPQTDANGKYVFATGNWYAAFSNNNGTDWTYLDPFSIFGTGFCCDQEVVYDSTYNRMLWLLQYNNRLVIASAKGSALAGANWCFWALTPAQLGLSGAYDFNKVALSTNNLFISSNLYLTSGGVVATVMRLPLSTLATCGNLGYNFFTSGNDFSVAFAQGAGDTMYIGSNWTNLTLGTGFRIYKWADNTTSFSWFDRTVTAYTFMGNNSGQNCGSANGVVLNWCQRTDSRMSGNGYLAQPTLAQGNGSDAVLGWAFNAKNDASHPKPYIRRVYFRVSDLAYLGASEIWNPDLGMLYPEMAADPRGHVGIIWAFGGGSGTSSVYPGTGLTLNDDIAPAQPWSFSFFQSGAGNPCLNSDGLRRWGDYLSVRPWSPSEYIFIATGFALNANAGSCSSTADVNVRNLIFGRDRERQAYLRWKGK